jgi:hypothetical protein
MNQEVGNTVTVPRLSLIQARQFLNQEVEIDYRVIPGYYSSKFTFDKIAEVITNYDQEFKLTVEEIPEIAEKCGTEPRRIKIVYGALRLAGWKHQTEGKHIV